MDVHISAEEIDRLFRLTHGDEMTPAALEAIGVNLVEIKPTKAQIHEAIKEMSLGEFLAVISGFRDQAA
jgi:ribosome maturation protein Sdo1